MIITFYETYSSFNTVDKILTHNVDYEIDFLDDVNVVYPIVTIKMDTILISNYVFISALDRYYFIESYDFLENGLYKVSLKIDVLMTYKVDILNSKNTAVLNSNVEKYYGGDNLVKNRKEVNLYYSDVTFASNKSDTILATTGNGG